MHQRGNVARAVVGLRDAHGLDVHDERRQHGRTAEQDRPAAAYQPLQTDLVGRRAGAEHPAPVRQPVTVPQDAAGAVVGRQDPPAPVQVEDADPRVVEQGGHGRVARFSADQRMSDANELPDVREQGRDRRDP